MTGLLVALPGAPFEGELVGRIEHGGGALRVVRRCVELADLLAAAAAGSGEVALVGADLRRLDRDAVARLHASGVAVLGVAAATDDHGRERLRAAGVAPVLAADAPLAALEEAVSLALERLGGTARGWADPAAALPLVADLPAEEAPEPAVEGTVVAVWGPAGAPGRSTVALGLASEAAALGVPTVLVDADTYGGVLAQALGLLDEAPGLAAAVRLAATGGLDVAALGRLAPEVSPRLRLLTGIPRAERWPELRPAALEDVLRAARGLGALVVVDCGFCLEQDEELSFDVAAPRRNAATLVALEQADVVLAVGSADPLGLQRLVRGLRELRDAVPVADPRVLVNRVRRSVVGPRPEQQLRDALVRYAGVADAVLVPEDRAGLDAALLAGRTLAEAAPGSPVREPLRALAAELTGTAPRRRRRSARRWAAARA
ncbi:Flp pilus assembly CpaE family ATPase [Motilibacter rhizosphaerae]|uniref:Flp pilus assembly CpaE family ATPase n=1 Tax=Motilibacter rhizosphaerae TaxID=598652 RepID=A0A4Q7NSL0_9ACTN|nr:chromosome partitioning protein [Motilibacter rhizosphaerae]RZS90123.1 Flp pilus assembly CpaE family ATPase [Motilibacter rhizosphaerae]